MPVAAAPAPVPYQTYGQRGPYLLVECLHRGIRTQVVMAHDTQLERSVTLKMPVDERRGPHRQAAALRAEARLLANFNHVNIVDLYTIVEDDVGPYLVMEYLVGDTLATRLARAPLDADTATDYFQQLLNGLDAVHRLGIVHGDLTPTNIFITTDGTVKILDFSTAHIDAYADGGREQLADDSLPYHAPERLHDSVCDAATDIYMVGMLLYHSVCGTDAPAINSAGVTAQLAALPKGLGAVIARATATDPQQRYRSAAEFRADLMPTLGKVPGKLIASSPKPLAQWTWQRYRDLTAKITSLPAFYVDAALVTILLAFIVGLGLTPAKKAKPERIDTATASVETATATTAPAPRSARVLAEATPAKPKPHEENTGERYRSLRKAWGTE